MTTTETRPTEYLDACPVARLRPDPINPRTAVAIDDDFIASIKAGIVEPLIVRPDPATPQLLDEQGPVDFLIVAGERRHAAAQAAELDTVPVLVRYDLDDDKDALVAMMVENGQRASLTPLDEARGYADLVERGMNQRAIAAAVGRDHQGHISKRLSLLKLPTRAQALLDSGRIGVKTALGLTGLIKHNDRMSSVLDWAARNGEMDDANIAKMVVTQLRAVQGEKDRAAQKKKDEKLIAAALKRGLNQVADDDDGYENYDECEHADATAFEVTDDGTVYWLKPREVEDIEDDKPAADALLFLDVTTAQLAPEGDSEPAAATYTETLADATIAEAARDYVAARHAHHQDPDELEHHIAVDSAWEHLRLACGYSHADFDTDELGSTEQPSTVADATPDIATVDEAFEEHQQRVDEELDVPDLPEPWKGYEQFGAARNIKVINGDSPWVTPDSLNAVIAYEAARTPARQQIIDAAQAKLDELAIVGA